MLMSASGTDSAFVTNSSELEVSYSSKWGWAQGGEEVNCGVWFLARQRGGCPRGTFPDTVEELFLFRY